MLLDQRRFGEWLELLAPQCRYWMPVNPDAADTGDVLCLIHDDRPRLEDRLQRLAGAHTEDPPARTARILGATVRVDDGNSAEVVTWTPFHLVVHRRNISTLFAGSYQHCLARVNDTFLIRSKRINIIESESPMPPTTIIF